MTRDEGSYTPCLLMMKPVFLLAAHATQSQNCFPAISNILTLCPLPPLTLSSPHPGGSIIFTTMPAGRITQLCQGVPRPLATPMPDGAMALDEGHSAIWLSASRFHGLRVVSCQLFLCNSPAPLQRHFSCMILKPMNL